MSTHEQRVEDRQHDEPAQQTGEDSEEVNGIPGQLVYPDVEVDAERAAAYAGGKEETLYDTEDGDSMSAMSEQERTAQLSDEERAELAEDQETEPAEMRGGTAQTKEDRK